MISAPCIELDKVSLHYRDASAPALVDVSLRVGEGERVALIGPSGAGKSSLISLLNTSAAPSTGDVRLFGVDPLRLRSGERRQLRARIGTIHQDLHLPGPLRVIHNVNGGHLGQWSTPKALWSFIRPQGVDEARNALDAFGIGDKLWSRTDELSGGERQRVGLARLVVQGAEVILADEPIASLDPARAREVLELLTEMTRAQGLALIVSLHAFDLAVEYFDRVIAVRGGRVLFDLPSTEVTEEHGRSLYELQAAR
jgi:phosphonate transport system ATP-binding protein